LRNRAFTPLEIEYCEERANQYQHYAARFAAKEAAFKAIGTGWREGVGWHDAEVRNELSAQGGSPFLAQLVSHRSLCGGASSSGELGSFARKEGEESVKLIRSLRLWGVGAPRTTAPGDGGGGDWVTRRRETESR
jgi:hypothetical protein